MSSTKVPDSLREMWETRPSRPREGRMVAGVAAAIARRYDVDPLLIRIGLAVSAFYGVGFALYLVAWMVLPPESDGDDRAAAPRPWVVVGLVVIGALSVSSIIGGDAGWVPPAIATVGLLYLLHRRSAGQSVLPRYRPPAAAPAPDAPAARVDLTKRPDGAAPAHEVPATPPSWDPLGAAPFAWDLPEPAQPTPPPAPRRRFPVTAVTLALMLLAVGVTTGVLLVAGALGPASLGVVSAVALTVVGLGLVAGAFLHTGRGLIPIAILVGVLTWGLAALPLEDWPDGPSTAVELAPTNVASVPALTSVEAGYVEYDLTGLDLSVPDGRQAAPVPVRVDVGAGYAEIRVPDDADVTFRGQAGLGYLSFGDGAGSDERGGTDVRLDVVDDLGADGVRDGRPLVIDVTTQLGYVEVSRG